MSNYVNNQDKQRGVEINIVGYFKIVLKRLWILVIVGVVCGLLGNFYVRFTSADYYKSSVSFIVNTLTENEMAESSAVTAQMNMANTFSYILSRRVMKEAVVEQCPSNIDYDLVDSSVTIETVASTNVIELTVKTEDPEISYEIAKAYVAAYADIVSEIYPNAKLTVCDTPVLAQSPSVERSVIIFAVTIGVVGPLILCIIWLIMYIIKDTVKTSDELGNKLDLPVLASIHQVENKGQSNRLLVTDKKTGFSFIETYKVIRTKIENNSAKTGNKVYLVTSACENEGKTTVAVNIALSLAQNGKNVLLVDADLRNPSVNKLLALPSYDSGFSDVITGSAVITDAVKFINSFNIYVLCDYVPVANPSELLSTKATEDIINGLRDEFDYIIIDTAPASLVTDTAVISGFSDAAVMVVREDFAPFSKICESISDIDSNGSEVIGCVFNIDTSSSVTGKKYGKYGKYSKYSKYSKYGKYNYSYGYGYGYGNTDKDKNKK